VRVITKESKKEVNKSKMEREISNEIKRERNKISQVWKSKAERDTSQGMATRKMER